MRILLISYYFPPFNSVGALRPGKLALYLLQQGHEVQVLSCANQPFPTGLALEVPEDTVCYAPAWSVNAPVEFLRGGRNRVAKEGFSSNVTIGSAAHRFGRLYKTLFHWPDAQLGWVGSAMLRGQQLLRSKSYDLIYVSAPPFSGLRVGARLSKEFNVPWIAELRDLWTDNQAYSFPALRKTIEKRWETRLLNSASALVTVSPPLVQQLRKFGRPVWEIRNGYSTENLVNLNRPESFKNSLDSINIVFTGNIYDEHYDVDTFCKGLSLYIEKGGKAHVYVAGRNTNGLRAAAQANGLSALFNFHSTVEHPIAVSMQRNADVLLTFLWDAGAGEGVYSAKLFEYAAAKRPILAIGSSDSDVGSLIEDALIGKACLDANDVAEYLFKWRNTKQLEGQISVIQNSHYDFTREKQFRLLEEKINRLLLEQGQGRRVCFVIANCFALNAFLSLPIAALSSSGWNITVAVNIANDSIPQSILANATVIPLPIERSINLFSDLRTLWRLWSIFRNGDFQIVHSVTPKAGLLAMLAAKIASVPIRLHTFTGQVWATRKGPMRWLLHKLDKLTASCATAVLTDSPSQADFLRDHGVPPKGCIKVLANGSICGVDTQRFLPSTSLRKEVRERLGIPENATVILYVGRFHREKGITELLAAFKTLEAENEQLHLMLVGPNEGAIELESIACNSRIHIVGLTSVPEHFMAASDIFCMPSYREGFGLTLLEAAATGLPSVSTQIYGVTDAVVDNVTGLLVSVADVAALVAALARLINSPDLRQKLGGAARERAAVYFSQDVLMKAWLEFYNLQRSEVTKLS